jgi:hypothetical protein
VCDDSIPPGRESCFHRDDDLWGSGRGEGGSEPLTREIGLTRAAERSADTCSSMAREGSFTAAPIVEDHTATALHTSRTIQLNSHVHSMSSTPLQQLWDASASQPFAPTISKDQQFTVGFVLLFAALVLTGLFGMSMPRSLPYLAVVLH